MHIDSFHHILSHFPISYLFTVFTASISNNLNRTSLQHFAAVTVLFEPRLVAQIMKLGTQQLDAECFAKFVPMIVDTKYHERPGAIERLNAVYRRKLKHVRFSNPDAWMIES